MAATDANGRSFCGCVRVANADIFFLSLNQMKFPQPSLTRVAFCTCKVYTSGARAFLLCLFLTLNISETTGDRGHGRSEGGIWVFIPPKSAQVNFYGVKMTSDGYSTVLYPKKLLYLPKQISGFAPDRGLITTGSL